MQSYGKCELCETTANCHDVPSSYLPSPPKTEKSRLHFLNGGRLEYTLALIKPDAVKANHVGAIIHMIEDSFIIGDMLSSRWDPADVAEFYGEHAGKQFYWDLVKFMSSERIIALTLIAPNAVEKWRQMMGPTDPKSAKEPTIRARFSAMDGIMMHNAVHGSDSDVSANREVNFVRSTLRVAPRFGEEAYRLIEKYKGLAWTQQGLQPV
jgi:nucleoside-diphosphate kinase